jgi:ABC-2 type transport system ATP-binding protein
MLAVEVMNLVKDFGEVRAIDDVSFEVFDGEIFGLIGPNGAGKTTALRIISTLLKATSGSVEVYGQSLDEDPNQVRSRISYLPEEAGAYENFSGRKYLEFMASFFGKGSKTRKIVERGIKIAKLGDRIDDKTDTYSKGMTRRLLVGRALMMEPKLAVLDEPTSGLDVTNAQEVRGIIKNYSGSGVTVLLSSHNMFEVEYLCHRVAMINRGKIVEEGKPSELKEKYNANNLEEVFTGVVS